MSLRLANVYDLSSRILLLKFAKPNNKKQIVIDSGFRCHLTEYARTTAAAPSAFVARLRKVLKTRRVTRVSQIGTDRILEFQFSDGQYRLYLEFFAVRGPYPLLSRNRLALLALNTDMPATERQHHPHRPRIEYPGNCKECIGGRRPGTAKHRVAVLPREQAKLQWRTSPDRGKGQKRLENNCGQGCHCRSFWIQNKEEARS